MNANISYLDGNVAGGELSRIFAFDLTGAEGQCADCGAKKRFADAHLYLDCPGTLRDALVVNMFCFASKIRVSELSLIYAA